MLCCGWEMKALSLCVCTSPIVDWIKMLYGFACVNMARRFSSSSFSSHLFRYNFACNCNNLHTERESEVVSTAACTLLFIHCSMLMECIIPLLIFFLAVFCHCSTIRVSLAPRFHCCFISSFWCVCMSVLLMFSFVNRVQYAYTSHAHTLL